MTKIADVIQPEIFNPYVIQRTMELSELYQSGIVQSVENLQLGVGKGNRMINMPYWNDLTGNSEVLSDTNALSPRKITAGQDQATQLFRGNAWTANGLAATLSGDDPMGAIGNLVAGYWKRDMQTTLVSVLKGVFNGPLATSHVNNIAAEASGSVTENTKISGPAIVDTISKLGDAHDVLTGMVMHSVVYFNLVKQDLIQYVKDSTGTVDIPTYLGKRVIVDDGVPTPAGTDGTSPSQKYVTYLFGNSAVGYAEGTPTTPTETDRDSLIDDDILINRKHFVLHPRGVKFTDTTVAGVSPSNAELENTNNWSKVFEDKAVRMVALITNG